MPTLIDSTVFIDVLRGHEPAVEFVASTRARDTLLSVTPVRTEVLGAIRDGEVRGAFAILRLILWMDVTVELADVAAALARRHRAAHRGISVIDYLLAAAALEFGATVATSNVRDFPMFPGLQPPY